MGLAGFKTAWQRQTKDFGHGQNTNSDQSNKYSCLIFDNRGMGESDKPLVRYSTSEMAKDTLDLVDHIGWTSHRQLHVIGVSLGGMIAQELVRLLRWWSRMFPLIFSIGFPRPTENSFIVIDLYRTENIQHCRMARESQAKGEAFVRDTSI